MVQQLDIGAEEEMVVLRCITWNTVVVGTSDDSVVGVRGQTGSDTAWETAQVLSSWPRLISLSSLVISFQTRTGKVTTNQSKIKQDLN